MPASDVSQYADDDYESVGTLFKLRAPALAIGLFLGIGLSFIASRFEEVLLQNVHVAFFLPFIVYIADAVGAQTGAIYSRDLRTGKANFGNYLRKELILGIIFGLIFSGFSGAVVFFLLNDSLLALSVSIASALAIVSAPLIALLTAHVFQSMHKDPAASTGPIATVIQDMLSVVIYGITASIVML